MRQISLSMKQPREGVRDTGSQWETRETGKSSFLLHLSMHLHTHFLDYVFHNLLYRVKLQDFDS